MLIMELSGFFCGFMHRNENVNVTYLITIGKLFESNQIVTKKHVFGNFGV